MSSFHCEHCGTAILDSPSGYTTGCEHYPSISAPADQKLDELISVLDEIGRDTCPYDYGLPIFSPEVMEKMRQAIRDWERRHEDFVPAKFLGPGQMSTFGLAHLKKEGAPAHPDDCGAQLTDEQYIRQSRAYLKAHNLRAEEVCFVRDTLIAKAGL